MTPFRQDTKSAKVFEILSDLEPHCPASRVPGSQPQGMIRTLRDRGYLIKTEPAYCEVCGSIETHDQLMSLDPQEGRRRPTRKNGPQAPISLDTMQLRSAVRSLHEGMCSRDWAAIESGVGALDAYEERAAGGAR